MEFTVTIAGSAPDLGEIEDVLRSVDPAALVDRDGALLRIAGAFDVATLQRLLHDAGQQVASADIRIVPSVCCGGCSG